MNTVMLKVDPLNPEQNTINKAAKLIQDGEIVAFPTETVYGLGADAGNDRAVRRIFEAKGRPQDNPIIVHIATFDQLKEVASEIPSKVAEIAYFYWPGPLTLIFKKSDRVSDVTTAGSNTVAVRMPSHPVALALINASHRPIAAPSANLSGRPSPTTAQHVLADLAGRIPMILDGGATVYGIESTVVDVSVEPAVILRPGPITREDLAPLLGEVNMHSKSVDRPVAPGMKYTHYAPKAPLILVESKRNSVVDKIKPLAEMYYSQGKRTGILCTDETFDKYPDAMIKISLGSRFYPYTIAKNLYACLRRMDELEVDMILAEGFTGDGIFETIMNRLRKASSRIVLNS
ncbi:MAG: L-threonylcarbamoyladenylate synthase [Nitrososphaerota archaeon]